MSASDKKRLRKEQNQAKADAKNAASAKEAAKLKLYSIIFAVGLVLMVLVFVVTSIFSTGILEKTTNAVQVGEHKLSSDMLNYFYIDQVYNWVDQYADYISMFGLDITKPLDQQTYLSTDRTWAENFMEQALGTIQTTYALYDDAIAHGVTLTEDDETVVKASLTNYGMQALQAGQSLDDYLIGLYGRGANLESFQQYLEVVQLATRYYSDNYDAFQFTDEDFQEAQKENFDKYSTYAYSYLFLSANDYRKGGTLNSDGTTTYSDDEIAAAAAAAKEDADSLLPSAQTDYDALLEAALKLDINAGKKESDLNTDDTSSLFDRLPGVMSEWLSDPARKNGDATVLESTNTTKDADGKEVTSVIGYYVVIFNSKNTNESSLVDIRNLLVAFQLDANASAPTEAQREAARKEASDLLLEWKAGAATEDTFAELAKQHSDDANKSEGGLIEDVYPKALLDVLDAWVCSPDRKAGETTILESDYGFHILYFVGPNGTSYRNYMIENELREAAATEWFDSLVENVEVELVNDRYAATDLVLYSY